MSKYKPGDKIDLTDYGAVYLSASGGWLLPCPGLNELLKDMGFDPTNPPKEFTDGSTSNIQHYELGRDSEE